MGPGHREELLDGPNKRALQKRKRGSERFDYSEPRQTEPVIRRLLLRIAARIASRGRHR